MHRDFRFEFCWRKLSRIQNQIIADYSIKLHFFLLLFFFFG